MANTGDLAPELTVSHWLNTAEPITLAGLRGRVVVIEAFQMLCPGCVHHGLPQAQRIRRGFATEQVAVIGLHTVFEHHAVQGTVEALRAFMHENRIDWPVGVDRPGDPLPATMARYGMRGTPTLLLIDPGGRLRAQIFGQADDLTVGAHIGAMLAGA